jgi:hypothetical protein
MQPFLAMITPLTAPESPGFPSHPIYFPPGVPTHPIAPGGPPPHVTHPIPPTIWPDPLPPPAVALPPWWPGAPAHPIPPIVVHPGPIIPPGTSPPTTPVFEWHTGWSESTGWVVVGVPQGEHITPSR